MKSKASLIKGLKIVLFADEFFLYKQPGGSYFCYFSKDVKITNMTQTSNIGLEVKQTEKLASALNELLANYQLFYQNARGFHWNIRGEKFFELHAKFEEIYTDALVKIDEIAERILTLGFTPLHSFTDYVKSSEIKELKQISEGHQAVEAVLVGLKVLLVKERKILSLSQEADDEGTNALMSDYIREQEKSVWMYTSWLGRK
jgi:starvation-inducible DNA-binding protein